MATMSTSISGFGPAGRIAARSYLRGLAAAERGGPGRQLHDRAAGRHRCGPSRAQVRHGVARDPYRGSEMKRPIARWWWVAVAAVAGAVVACSPAGAGPAATGPASGGPRYVATIVRTAYGIPHITARNFASLGYGVGYAFASDDICTMADAYLTVEGERSRYFGPKGSAGNGPNLQSDFFWQSVIQSRVIARLLSVRTGAGAVGPQLRQLVAGYVAGYNGYLASVGGAKGVPDPTCRGQAWVKPITALDAYLRMYQIIDSPGSGRRSGRDHDRQAAVHRHRGQRHRRGRVGRRRGGAGVLGRGGPARHRRAAHGGGAGPATARGRPEFGDRQQRGRDRLGGHQRDARE